MSGRKNKVGELPDPKEFARRQYAPRTSWDFADVVTGWLELRRTDWCQVLADHLVDEVHEGNSALVAVRYRSRAQWALDRLNEMRRAVDELGPVLKAEAAAHLAEARAVRS